MDVPIIGMIVGLTFVLLLFSVLASHITETVASVTGLRGKFLYDAIAEMFQSTHFRRTIYDHPLVHSLSTGGVLTRRSPRRKPSYISPDLFALVVIDLGIKLTEPTKILRGKTEILDCLDSEARAILQTLVGNTFGNVTATQAILQNWFSDCMKRASGSYKRMTFPILLFISVVLCGMCDVDVIRIGNRLYNDPFVRSVTVQQAQTSDAGGRPNAEVLTALTSLQVPIGWWSTPQTGQAKADSDLGRSGVNVTDYQGAPDGLSYFKSHQLLGCCGLALASILLSLGAPFWFDMANKMVNVRGAGPQPAPRPIQLAAR
jgi:hypothetical protein